MTWLRDAGAATTLTLANGHTLETDAAFVIASLGSDYALLAGGTYLKRDGKTVLTANAAPVAVFTP